MKILIGRIVDILNSIPFQRRIKLSSKFIGYASFLNGIMRNSFETLPLGVSNSKRTTFLSLDKERLANYVILRISSFLIDLSMGLRDVSRWVVDEMKALEGKMGNIKRKGA